MHHKYFTLSQSGGESTGVSEKTENSLRQTCKAREFTVGQAVWVKGQNHQQSWLPGVIVKQRNRLVSVSYVSEQLWHRHIDHLREREQDEARVQGAEDAEYFPNRQPGSADDQDIITDENAPNPQGKNA